MPETYPYNYGHCMAILGDSFIKQAPNGDYLLCTTWHDYRPAVRSGMVRDIGANYPYIQVLRGGLAVGLIHPFYSPAYNSDTDGIEFKEEQA